MKRGRIGLWKFGKDQCLTAEVGMVEPGDVVLGGQPQLWLVGSAYSIDRCEDCCEQPMSGNSA